MRGLYGENEGNENRNQTAVFNDHLRENEIAEGEYLKPMERFAKKGKLKAMGKLRDQMKADYIAAKVDPFLAQERADTVLRQAMRLLRI